MGAPITPRFGGGSVAGGPREPLFDPSESSDLAFPAADPYAPRFGATAGSRVGVVPGNARDDVDWGSDPVVMSQAMGAEMFKIVGLKYEHQEWSWNPSNVAQYFRDEPVWATFDALTLAAPMAKWGKAAALVGRGESAAGKAFKAGEIGYAGAVKLQAKNLAPTTRLGRFVTNPAARERFTPAYQKLIEQHGATEWERQAGLDVLRREHAAATAATSNRALNVVAKLNKANLTPEQQKAFVRAMESGWNPTQAGNRAMLGRLIGEEGTAAFESAWQFRAELGAEALDVGALSSERALAQDTYWPQLVKDQYEAALGEKGVHFNQHDVFADASWDNFKHRKYMTEEFEKNFVRDFDPINGVRRMAAAFQAVKREKFARGMKESGLVQDSQELLGRILAGEFDNPATKRVWGMGSEQLNRLKAAAVIAPKNADGTIVEEAAARIFRDHTPFARLSDVAPGLKLPLGYGNLVVDKAVAPDLAAGFKLMSGPNGLLGEVHGKLMKTFMLGKTAYNPATHFRNIFGAGVFHTLATGLTSMTDGKFWLRGWKAYRGGWEHPMFRKAAEAGIINGTIDGEFDNAVRKLYGGDFHGSNLGFLGDSKVASVLQKMGGKIENFYRGIDDVSRLDAFARNYESFIAANKSRVRTDQILQAHLIKKGTPEWTESEVAREVGQIAPGPPGGVERRANDMPPGSLNPSRRASDVRGMTEDADIQAAMEAEIPAPPEPRQLGAGPVPRQIEPIARPTGAPPVNEANTRGGKLWFHGSPKDVKLTDETVGGAMSRFGPGFYATDATDVSESFAARRGHKNARQYEVVPKPGVKLYDMSVALHLDAKLRDTLADLTKLKGAPGRIVRDALASNPTNLAAFYADVEGLALDAGVDMKALAGPVHGRIRRDLEARGFAGLHFTDPGAAAEKVFWRPKRDVELRPTPLGKAAVQRGAPRGLPARTMGGETLEAWGAGQPPVPPSRGPLAPAPPGGMGPARPSGLPGRALAPVGPQAVGPAKVLHKKEIAVDGMWSAAELERRAVEYASLQVAKFMPSFMLTSRLSQAARGLVPFATFSHEAVRVWKNTMVEKPHLAAFWSHFADSASQFMGAAAGFTPDEINTARGNLPYYQEGKKMLMWPSAVDGKPVFVDMSYLIPLANIVEVERDEQTLFGKVASFAGVNITSNPIISSMMAASTGTDPFRNQPLAPNFTERQLGVPVESYKGRAMVGLAEHVAATFLPPVVPPGYVGTNLVEHIRGQTHPQTGQELEEGTWRTLATNLMGVRLHEADANAAMLNVGHNERAMNTAVADWWGRWQWAVSNGRNDDAERAEKNLFELRIQRGDTPEAAMEYLRAGVKDREPGAFRNYPKKDLRKALKSLRQTGVGPPGSKDAKAMAAMMAAARNQRRARTWNTEEE